MYSTFPKSHPFTAPPSPQHHSLDNSLSRPQKEHRSSQLSVIINEVKGSLAPEYNMAADLEFLRASPIYLLSGEIYCRTISVISIWTDHQFSFPDCCLLDSIPRLRGLQWPSPGIWKRGYSGFFTVSPSDKGCNIVPFNINLFRLVFSFGSLTPTFLSHNNN